MLCSEPTAHGYLMAQVPAFHGTPAEEFWYDLHKGLIHKHNNFLAVIQGFASLILMGGELDSTTKENLDHIKEATQGATAMGERFLTAAGLSRMNLQSVQLADYLPLMEGILQAPCQRLNVPLQVTIAPGVPPVKADNAKLKDLLLELIVNGAEAVAASGKPGAVALDVLPPGKVPEGRPGFVDIFVRNTGAVPAEKFQDAFKSFKTTRDGKHLGIGLKIAAMLATQMGGTLGLRVQQDPTTFWVSLPAA
jgi:C4-dicarboxylate-specific signal transduction histidine kinase